MSSAPPRKTGTSYAEIAAAADRLTANGERPTVRAVRAEIGGGSLATIQRHFTEWKGGRRAAPVSAALSPELQRVILAEMERSSAAVRAELETELADTQAERDALTAELERQGETLAASEERAEAQSAEVERQAGALALLERGLADAREQAAREREAAEAARKAAALAELRLESLPQLHAEIKALRADLATEREARRVAEIEAAEWRGKHGGA